LFRTFVTITVIFEKKTAILTLVNCPDIRLVTATPHLRCYVFAISTVKTHLLTYYRNVNPGARDRSRSRLITTAENRLKTTDDRQNVGQTSSKEESLLRAAARGNPAVLNYVYRKINFGDRILTISRSDGGRTRWECDTLVGLYVGDY